MKVGIIVYSNDSEIVWNALRFANLALSVGDEVKVFLLGEGVEIESLDTDKINVTEQLQTFVNKQGKVLACGLCLEFHQVEASSLYTVATMKDLYDMVKESDKTVAF